MIFFMLPSRTQPSVFWQAGFTARQSSSLDAVEESKQDQISLMR